MARATCTTSVIIIVYQIDVPRYDFAQPRNVTVKPV
jgi:hypothetical protein